jgi:O-antigen/teichoic acid export membrane protein
MGLLILLPLALSRLPVEEASLWLLFSALLGLSLIADFGFGPTFIRAVAYSNTKKSLQGIHQAPECQGSDSLLGSVPIENVIGTMRSIYNSLALILVLLAGLLGSLAVAGPIGQTTDPILGWFAWAIIVVGGAFSFRGGMYGAFLQGSERIALYRRWEILTAFLTMAGAIYLLMRGGGVLGIVFMTQLGACANVLINSRLAIRLAPPGAWQSPARKDTRVMRSIWPPAWRSGLGILLTYGTVQGSAIIYAQLAGPSAVASYLLAQRLSQTLGQFSNVPFYTRLPGLARLYIQNERSLLLAQAGSGMLRSTWSLVLGLVFVGLFANNILAFIGSETPFVDADIWWVMSFAMLIERVGAMHLQLYSATNHIVWHVANGISGLVMLVSIPMLYYAFGVIGLPLGALLGFGLFYLPYSISKSYSRFDLRFTTFDAWANALPAGFLLIFALAN